MRTMINHTKQSWWLTLTGSIIGFDEGGEGGAAAGAGAPASEAAGTAGEGSGEPAGASGSEGGEDAGNADTTGLKSALQKERAERKSLEKELKTFRTAQQQKDDADKTEVERLKGENGRVAERAAKLAAGFKTNAVETAILKAAGAAKFRDPSDALRAEVIAAIGVEQDDDDPTKITIDADTVTAAIKQLAKSKPHYITNETPRLPRSGSAFGGTGGTQSSADEQKARLQKMYPALRGL